MIKQLSSEELKKFNGGYPGPLIGFLVAQYLLETFQFDEWGGGSSGGGGATIKW